MIRFATRLLWAVAALLALSGSAFAQFNMLPEIRAGVSMRGIDGGANLFDPNRIGDANVELLFAAPDLNAWTVIGELRPHLGATVSFRGQDSYGYAGLSWTFQAPILPVFVEASLGGVDTRDLDAKTMAARDVPGLYFVGEVVDVTGWLGGYNFQWAWASGWAAGQVA